MTSTSSPNSDSPSDLSSSDAYDVLSDKRRRYTIHYLKQVENPVDVGEVAEQVAAWENDKSMDKLDSQERRRVYISLYQSHLPTLDEEGLVDYNEARKTVALSEPLVNADIYMEIVSKNNISWNYFYVGLTIAAGLLLLSSWQGIGVFERIPLLFISSAIVLGYGITAIVHTIEHSRMKLGDSGPPPELKNE